MITLPMEELQALVLQLLAENEALKEETISMNLNKLCVDGVGGVGGYFGGRMVYEIAQT